MKMLLNTTLLVLALLSPAVGFAQARKSVKSSSAHNDRSTASAEEKARSQSRYNKDTEATQTTAAAARKNARPAKPQPTGKPKMNGPVTNGTRVIDPNR